MKRHVHTSDLPLDVHSGIIHDNKRPRTMLERTKCASRGEWINKFQVCPCQERCAATKRKLLLIHPKVRLHLNGPC